MSKLLFDAVIFDLDGVITQTAILHVESWKETFDEYLHLREKRDKEPFREFTHKGDYLPFVDGKPRYEGVESFLASRKINLPFGEVSDAQDKETVCGIGNKKNEVFVELIKHKGAQVFTSTLELIKELRNLGVKTGVASSSKNCEAILKSVEIEDLFQTRVDGVVSADLGLNGKPEADIFVTAANNLGVSPKRSVVVEDASSGVQAGRNGGFGLVIGIARENNEKELFENGADVVVQDLGDISISWIDSWFHRKPVSLFEFWDKNRSLAFNAREISKALLNPGYLLKGKDFFLPKKKSVFFLDYDGTLTPIVDKPEYALISQEMKKAVADLARKYTVAIVSGRRRQDVENIIGIKDIFYAGNHGLDIKGPGVSMVQKEAEKVIPLIEKITKYFKEKLSSIPGILVEEKKFSVALHYRLVKEERYIAEIETLANKVVSSKPDLRIMRGKKVFEILPAIDWNKGRAIRWMMEALGLDFNGYSIIYIGDDTTDEDAFRAIRTRGCGILVSDGLRTSAADFWLKSPDDVKKLFAAAVSAAY